MVTLNTKSWVPIFLRGRYISDWQFRWFLVVSFSFNLVYSFIYFNDQGLWDASRVPLDPNTVIFQDDRDGWLRAAQFLVQDGAIGTERWQLNFWPPGQVLFTTLLVFFFRNYQLILMAHVGLCSMLLVLIYRKVFRLTKDNSVRRNLVFCSILFWNFSFMNKSSITTLVLCPDYIAALLFALGLLIVLDTNLEEKSRIQRIAAAALMSSAAYLRITFYQAVWMILAFSFVLYIMSRRKGSVLSQANQLRVLVILLTTIITFLPWVGIRYYVNGETLVKAFQFSEQSRFSMTVAWWDQDVIEKFRAQHIGAGIACKIDPIKCKFFSNRDKAILSGKSNIDWGRDADEKTQAAFRAYLSNPGVVLKSKLPILWNAYFQRIAFSSIEGKPYYTWDKVIFFVALIASFVLLFRNRKQAPILLMISVLGVGWSLTLLLTQVEFRYLLPTFVMILMPIAQLHKYKSPQAIPDRVSF